MSTYQFPSSVLGTPGNPTDDGGVGMTVGITVTARIAGLTATGIRWYAGFAGDTVTPYLWEPTGGTPAQRATGATVTVTAGWNFLPFATPYPLTSGGDYYVGAYQAATQHYNYLVGTAASTTQFLSVTNGGAYHYGTGAFLNPVVAGSSNAWFGVDLVATDGNAYSLDTTVVETVTIIGGLAQATSVSGAIQATSTVTGVLARTTPLDTNVPTVATLSATLSRSTPLDTSVAAAAAISAGLTRTTPAAAVLGVVATITGSMSAPPRDIRLGATPLPPRWQLTPRPARFQPQPLAPRWATTPEKQ